MTVTLNDPISSLSLLNHRGWGISKAGDDTKTTTRPDLFVSGNHRQERQY